MGYMENFMRDKKSALLGVLLMSCAGGVFAGPNLSVRGSIEPVSCVPSFASPVLDFGSLSFPEKKGGEVFRVPSKTVGFALSCSSAISLAFSFDDLRKSSVSESAGGTPGFNFGLGMQGDHKIGYYDVLAKNITLDGNAGELLASNDGGLVWRRNSTGIVLAPLVYSFVVTGGGADPGSYREYAGDIEVSPFVGYAGVDLTKPLELDGAIVMNVKYI
ncbi:DUF1120 domain-containing protein [Pseudomonas sp. NCIMB 10586]|nr:DUF1120 domain-containing protein [Pseudomonas sp. NCIMB 10586]VCU67865.1 Hypothetical new protein [Pseudomonas synxantha]